MVTVTFRTSAQEEQATPYVSIRPTDMSWNDFGFNFQAIVRIRLKAGGPTLELPALVVPIDKFDGTAVSLPRAFYDWLKIEFKRTGKNYLDSILDLPHSDFPKFVTLLKEESGYRKFAEFVQDQTLRNEILLKINDFVLLRANNISSKLTDSIMGAQQFQLGVMRTGSAFRALHRGKRYLTGNYVASQAIDARSAFDFECGLMGFQGKPHSLSVAFIDNDVIPDRIHCLIGRNGCGKSRLLRELILYLGHRASANETGETFLEEFASTAREGTQKYKGQNYARVLAIVSDAKCDFPSAVRSDSQFEYHLANLHQDEIQESGTNASTRLLVDLMRSTDAIGDKSRWTMFRSSLTGYVEIADLYLPLLPEAHSGVAITVEEQKWVNVGVVKGSSEQTSLELYAMLDLNRSVCFIREGRKIRLSSGERMYFRFALNLLSYIDSSTVLMIDEPETHLHPNLVCDFMNLLYEVVTATNSIALIATHSAYVVREVPTHCAHIYSIDNERTPSERFVYLKTLGASVESISQAIFADSNIRKFHQQIEREMASKGKTIEALIEAYASFVSPEMLSQVARLMEKKNPPAGQNEKH